MTNTDKRVAALDHFRFDAITETAEMAGQISADLADAATSGDRVRTKVYAGLLSRAVRSALLIVAELGSPEVRE